MQPQQPPAQPQSESSMGPLTDAIGELSFDPVEKPFWGLDSPTTTKPPPVGQASQSADEAAINSTGPAHADAV